MRITDDTDKIKSIQNCVPVTKQAAAIVGAILQVSSEELPVGTPLHYFVTGDVIQLNWREWVGPVKDSLWSEYSFLAILFESDTSLRDLEGSDHLNEYFRLKKLADD